MTIARTVITASPGTIANNATSTSAEQDPRADDASEGWGFVWLTYTSTAAAGTIDVSIAHGPTTGTESTTQLTLLGSFVPINGTETNVLIGILDFARFFKVIIKNNAVGASITSVTWTIEYSKRS